MNGQVSGFLPAGKLPVSLLRRFLARLQHDARDRRIVVGPGIGLDAAAIRLGNRLLIAKTDPITLVGEEIGAYALTINANDLATMGATPQWFLATILLPAGGTTAAHASRTFTELRTTCRRLQVALVGGHTEITDAVTRPVIVGCLLGECRNGRLVTTAGARVGDALLLTKGIPIEAVSIVAREQAPALRKRFSVQFIRRCRRFLENPGIGVLRDAAVALKAGGVHAMHDPTEGGLSAALYELAEAAGVGLRVEEAAVPILPEGARLCAEFGINPLGAIASGALLISADPRHESGIKRALSRAGIRAVQIGTVTPAREGVRIVTQAGQLRPFPRFEVDEIARVLADG
jgi:hydrogenase maturation factor